MRTPSINLLAFPCAGASANMYLRWQRLLPPWIRLVAVELPGRGALMEDRAADNLDALIAHVFEKHHEVLRSRCAFLGHSMGALLAYGIVRRMHVLEQPLPQTLFVSASPAPSMHDASRFQRRNDIELTTGLRKHGGTPDEVFQNDELLRLTLDTLSSDYQVCASFRYVVGPPLPLHIRAFTGRADDISPAAAEAWGRETARSFALRWFDGGHFFIRQHEAELIHAIVQQLQEDTEVQYAQTCAT